MTNKQLGILVLAIFAAVLLAYQLFVGFDFRSPEQRRYDEAVAEHDAFMENSIDDACAKMAAAGQPCNR